MIIVRETATSDNTKKDILMQLQFYDGRKD